MTDKPPFTVSRYGSLGAAITAERDYLAAEIERRNALLACAYQLAGYYDAPIRFLNAFALFDEYTKMSPDQIMDALLPITDQPTGDQENADE